MTAPPTSQTSKPFDHYPYSIKRHGLTLTTCESEPVHTPGCVQAHGALLVLRLSDLCILQASENTQLILGRAPEEILGQAVRAVIGANGEGKLLEMLDSESTDHNPLYLLTVPALRTAANDHATTGALDVTAHTVDGVVILEFEATDRTGATNPDYYALVKNTVSRLQTMGSLQHFYDSVAQEIKTLTGMDRVMIHRFHADGHGEVFAESRGDELHSWVGMHFPADDIPEPVRALFKKTWIRPVPDAGDALAELVPLVNPDTGKALNMTYCALRGASVMYTEYLRNMGVGASLTMAIRRNETLWGLIACHHYAGPKYVSYQVRSACELLAQVVSLQHHAAQEKEHSAYRRKIESAHRELVASAAEGGGLAALTSDSFSLLDGIHAGGAAVFHLDRWWRVGNTPSELQLDALGDWLITQEFASSQHLIYATDSLVQDYSPAEAFVDVASGLLALPISLSGRNLMLWFRPETLQNIEWRGDPHYQAMVLGPNGPRLTPRGSFDVFAESVRQRSLPWLEVETECANAFRLLIMEMVVNRAARLANLSADLARSNEELDAFAYVASHDLKEPLRGITLYANQLIDDAGEAGDENRGKLDRLKQLTQRMDGLLDSLLNYSRAGRAVLTLESADLNEVLSEAVQMLTSRQSSIEVTLPRPLPTVRCQRMWCRQVLVNLLSNARIFNNKTDKQIEVGYIDPNEQHSRAGCPDGQETQTIFYVADNGIGIEAKHFDQAFKLFRRLHGRDEYGGGGGAGLTIARKLVERHGGKIWLASNPGDGTTVYFTLPEADFNLA